MKLAWREERLNDKDSSGEEGGSGFEGRREEERPSGWRQQGKGQEVARQEGRQGVSNASTFDTMLLAKEVIIKLIEKFS